MIAYHGDEKIKGKYLDRVHAHIKADKLKSSVGWRDNIRILGRYVGVTPEKYDYKLYEIELGIPEWLARACDVLFDGMSYGNSMEWPATFLKAITPGVDLDKIKIPFLIFVLESCLTSMNRASFDRESSPMIEKALEESRKAVVEMIRVIRGNGKPEKAAGLSAKAAAKYAAFSAKAAAKAEDKYAARSAKSAAESAEKAASLSAKAVAWATKLSGESAAWSAKSIAFSEYNSAKFWTKSAREWALWSSERSAKIDAYILYADKLIKLLEETK